MDHFFHCFNVELGRAALRCGAEDVLSPRSLNRHSCRVAGDHWLGDSLARLRAAPAGIRSSAGYQLDLVQRGENPADFRPMPDVGAGVMEIRLHGENEFRVFYVARFEEAIYVLHAFVKKTGTTRKADIDLGKARYAAMLEARKSRT